MTFQIRSVEVLPGFRVRLRLSDGSFVERGLRRVVREGVFEPLRQEYDLFRRVRVRHGALTWPGGVDLDPETVIWGATPEQRQRSRLFGQGVGIRWDELDEDLSVEGLVRSAAWVGLQITPPGGQASPVGS
jgi:hypothetical protein